MHGHRLLRALDVLRRLGTTQLQRLVEGHAVRHVAVQGVVGAGLVGDDVGVDATAHQFGEDVGGVGDDRDRQRPAVLGGGLHPGEAVVERVGDLVEVAVVEPALGAGRVDLDAQRRAAVAGDGERLRAAHPAEPGGQHPPAGQRAAEVLVATSAKVA